MTIKAGDRVQVLKPYVAIVESVDFDDGVFICHGHRTELRLDEQRRGEARGGDTWEKIDDDEHTAWQQDRCHLCGYPMVQKVKPYRCRFGDKTGTVDVDARWCIECGEGYLNGEALERIEKLHEALQAEYNLAIRQETLDALSSSEPLSMSECLKLIMFNEQLLQAHRTLDAAGIRQALLGARIKIVMARQVLTCPTCEGAKPGCCCQCKDPIDDGEYQLLPCPWADETSGNDSLHLRCSGCREQAARDI